MWFQELVGFREESPEQVRSQCFLDGLYLESRANGRRIRVGEFEIPTLGELRSRSPTRQENGGSLVLNEVVADVQELHRNPEHGGSVFQVASQFNLLEMVGPGVAPEDGVGRYEEDRTQGPACAIAAGGGTIFRNYFVPVGSQIGQSFDRQIDCLAGIGERLGNQDESLWRMKNGYALPNEHGMNEINRFLSGAGEDEKDELRSGLAVGIHWNVEVTLNDSGNQVVQVYGSALPVSYSPIPAAEWESFARLILEASYEATFRAALLHKPEEGKRRTLFLTLLGGGAFGNHIDWILDAIRRSCTLFRNRDLHVKIVSYRSSRPKVAQLVNEIGNTS